MTRPAYILPVIIYSQFTGASLWFAGNAVILDLQRDWGLVEQSVGYVTAAVQIGFIAGTLVFAFFALADRFSPRIVFFICSTVGAPSEYVGSALTIVNSIGFMVTIVSIQLVNSMLPEMNPDYIFWVLIPGPVLGLWMLKTLINEGLLND